STGPRPSVGVASQRDHTGASASPAVPPPHTTPCTMILVRPRAATVAASGTVNSTAGAPVSGAAVASSAAVTAVARTAPGLDPRSPPATLAATGTPPARQDAAS